MSFFKNLFKGNKEQEVKKEQIVVGIDIGVKSLVVTSNGETFGNPNIIKNMKRE